LDLLQGKPIEWPDRMLFFQWHRGDRPEPFQACAVRSARYKLVQPAGRDGKEAFEPMWALYDMSDDPGERHNLIEQHSSIARRMKSAYESWFAEMGRTRGYPAPRIIVGTKHENPVTLTRQDWRGPRAGWDENSLGYWDIEVAAAGAYDITLRMPLQNSATVTRLRIGDLELTVALAEGAEQAFFKSVRLPAGKNRLEGSVEQGSQSVGVHYVDLLWHDPANKEG
jgi:hypothetical protein